MINTAPRAPTPVIPTVAGIRRPWHAGLMARLRRAGQALALCLCLLPTFATSAQVGTDVAPLQFNDAAEERRFRALVSELRCVMCQNQSLADSNAQIAVDLRHEVLALMRSGRSDAEVREFLVARYGEFVLYRPRVEGKTWLLWFAPALFLIAGGMVIVRIVRQRRRGSEARLDEEQEW